MSDWHRADEGDVPNVGDEISMCVYQLGDTSVKRWHRMRVEIIYATPGTTPRILGPGLWAGDEPEPDWPERPEQINGRAIFWRLT